MPLAHKEDLLVPDEWMALFCEPGSVNVVFDIQKVQSALLAISDNPTLQAEPFLTQGFQ